MTHNDPFARRSTTEDHFGEIDGAHASPVALPGKGPEPSNGLWSIARDRARAKDNLPGDQLPLSNEWDDCISPRMLFAEPSQQTLFEALLEVCDGNPRFVDALQTVEKLEFEVKRLRKELTETQVANKTDPRVYPYLEIGEKNTYVRLYTHGHARSVVQTLPPGERALFTTLLTLATWGGYVEHSCADLIVFSRLTRSTYYARMRTLRARALVVQHPFGVMLNPAVVECCAVNERYAKGQEFAAFYDEFRFRAAKKKGGKAAPPANEPPVACALAGPLATQVVSIFGDGSISACVYDISTKHAATIVEQQRKAAKRKSARPDKKQQIVRVVGQLPPGRKP